MNNINKDDHPERCEIQLKPGERVAICRCWQSKKFPFCDGAHRGHNQENNCCLGPAIVIAKSDQS